MQFDKDVTGFTGGVSQQPAFLRSDTQCDESLNALPSLVYGNMKRPPMEHVALLSSKASLGAFMHTINRDKTEKYNMILTGDASEPLEVYTADGTKCTIRYGHLTEDLTFTSDLTVKDYIMPGVGEIPRETFKATTIADHTLIVNTGKVCTMSGIPDPVGLQNVAYGIVKKPVALTTYYIYINDALAASFTTPDSSEMIRSNDIAQLLVDALNNGTTWTRTGSGSHTWVLPAAPAATHTLRVDGAILSPSLYSVTESGDIYTLTINGSVDLVHEGTGEGDPTTYATLTLINSAPSGYTYTVKDSTIRIVRNDGGAFKFRMTDSWGNEATHGIYQKTQSYQNLPARFFDDAIVEVTGDPTNSFDNYFVKFNGTAQAWEETVKPGLDNKFKASTLPHRLVRTGVNEFTLADITWASRQVGDEFVCSAPSFIGNTINEVFYYRNRLGFFSGENSILSKAGDFFNFWPTTATESLDDDPIDVAGNAGEIVKINHALPYEKTLLAIGDEVQMQFHTGSQIALTPRTWNSDVTTRFSVSPLCKPVMVGSNAYMAVQGEESTRIYEYFLQANSVSFDAADITSHCPSYLPRNVVRLVGSSIHDMLFAFSTDTPRTLYVYKYYWEGDSKAQSAWGKWTFPVDILDVTMLDNNLYLVVTDDAQVSLQKINLQVLKTGNLPRVNLDRRVAVQGSYSEGGTTWVLPYAVTEGQEFVAVRSDNGTVALRMTVQNGVLWSEGDHSAVPYLFGQEYTHRLDLSEFILKDGNGKPYLQGTTLLRTFAIGYSKTGHLEVHVITPGRDPDVYQISPFSLGSAFNEVALGTGTFNDTLIMSDAKDARLSLQNPTWLPSVVVSASYEGSYYSRSKKV